MKSLSAYKLSMGAIACAFFVACSQGDQDVVPQMDKSKATPSAQPVKKADAPAEEEPELVPLKSLSGDNSAEAATEAAAPAPAKAAPVFSGSNQPQQDGQYVIQVGIKPSRKAAQAIADKLAESNISAYLVEVENPGELEGTYYRVRVGYFSTIASAQAYGKEVIAALNLDWWVDNRSNDQVGNPSGGYYGGSQSYDDSQSYEEEEPAPAPEPEPAPAPAPAKEAAPAPAPAAQPAPAPAKPAPAPEAKPAPAPAPAAQPAPAPAKPAPAPEAKPAPAPAPAAKPAPAPAPAQAAAPAPAPAAKPAPAPAPAAKPAPAPAQEEEEEVVEEVVEEYDPSKQAPANDVVDDWE